jgi:hypothetical protein
MTANRRYQTSDRVEAIMTRTFVFGVVLAAFLVGLYIGTYFINQETRHFCALLASKP